MGDRRIEIIKLDTECGIKVLLDYDIIEGGESAIDDVLRQVSETLHSWLKSPDGPPQAKG